MDEETQNNSQAYVITHSIDGWVYQLYDQDPSDGSNIYKCPACGDMIKVLPVVLDTTSDEIPTIEEPQQQQQEQPLQQLDTRSDQEIEQQQTTPRKQRKSKRVLPSHEG